MNSDTNKKLYLYQVTVILSLFFALVGFSYNVWRMEASEQNSNIRTACFEMLLELSSLEQLVYAAHYDKDAVQGSPRKGWVKVGLIKDLSVLTTGSIEVQAGALTKVWDMHWVTMQESRSSTDKIVVAIESVRGEIRRVMRSLD